MYFKIFFTECANLSSVNNLSLKACLNFSIAVGTFSAKSNTSFPAKKAAKSISPGCLKLLAPFIFSASVKINPSNFNWFFKISVTTFSDKEEG